MMRADLLNTAELTEAAKRMKLSPILSPDDLPTDMVMLSEPEHLVRMLRKGGHTVISSTGMIYTACPHNHSQMASLRNFVAKSFGVQAHTVRVTPTSELVVRGILGLRESDNDAGASETAESATDAQQLLGELISAAAKRGSSDIHLNVEDNDATVRMRIDGRLRFIRRMTRNDATALCSVAVGYEAAINNGAAHHFQTTEPLDATFDMKLAAGSVMIRFALTPSQKGFKVVFRLLAFSGGGAKALPSLDQLGYQPEQWYLMQRAVQSPQGLVVVSGPTGSGKSTTLAVMMSMLPEDKAIYAYEDPIENHIPNALQVPVKAESEKCDWVGLSRNSLRMDPDVIMYGELRERRVAEVIVQAASTGHLVLTTLHTNSAPSIVQRMNDLGVSYHRLADPGFLRVLVFQRLVAKVCPDCSTRLTAYQAHSRPESMLVDRLRTHYAGCDTVRVHQPGQECSTCSGTGLHKRALVAEVVLVDERGREFIERGDLAGWLSYLRSKGWRDVRDNAEVLVKCGDLCPLFTQSELGVEFGPERYSIEVDYNALAEEASQALAYGGAAV